MAGNELPRALRSSVDTSGAQGVQIGDGNTQYNHFSIHAGAILPRPVQLPRAVPDFQGRAIEMEAVHVLLEDHSRRVSQNSYPNALYISSLVTVRNTRGKSISARR